MEQAELDEQLLDTNTPVNIELPTIPDVRKFPLLLYVHCVLSWQVATWLNADQLSCGMIKLQFCDLCAISAYNEYIMWLCCIIIIIIVVVMCLLL